MKHVSRAARLVALVSILAAAAQAHEYKIGDLVIEHPYADATPKGAQAGAGFMTIENTGKTAERLLSATVENADRVEIHQMSMEGGVMKMSELPKGLEIPAGGKVELKPGGYHLMLLGLKAPIVSGHRFKGALTFEHAGAVAVEFATEADHDHQHMR